jgi:multiple sugar transport system permease protein
MIPIIVIMAGPFAWMFLSAFKSATEIVQIPPTFLPNTWTLDNFSYIFSALPFARYFLNSAIMSIGVTALTLLTSSLAGFVFAKYEFWGKEVLFTFIVSLLVIPFATIVVPLYILVSSLKLTNTYVGLILPICVSSFGIFLLRQFMEGIPNELLDAARVDGASDLWMYWRVALPLSKSALAGLGIFAFLYSWNLLWWPWIVTSAPDMFTLTLGVASLQFQGASVPPNVVVTGAAMAVIPAMIVFGIAQPHIVKGIALTGMK